MNDSDYDETGLDFFDGIDTSLLNQEEPPKYFFLGADKSEEIEDEFEDEVVYSFPKERSLGDLFSADIIDEDRGENTINIRYVFDGIRLGYASLEVDRSPRTITWVEFYPYDGVPKLMGKGFGLGAIAHYHTLAALLDEAGIEGDFFVSHKDVHISDDRLNHLARMGITEDLPAIKEISIVGNYILESEILSNDNLYRLMGLINQK